MSDRTDTPPSKPKYRVDKRGVGGRYPFDACGACGRKLPNADVWRCPYVGCREWLKGLDEIDTGPKADQMDGHDEPTVRALAFDYEAHA